ncbi:hypothetical protein ACG33_13945 [Steroidobacter denitrificans]|uniref:Response regulatory domain-containing protein n=1 Tax=Steroidobacter denitrificans TaxID=465721 RepID=A0A127FEA2_STEDE|nr:response regulator [Steroidobacter denitrificans]AMN48179.1 hypothetical protein ACG33_13945 [Steroidobacter denitrificans]
MKRALIVDDSRSARIILSRMLESYDLEVDACESAEQALEHLRHSRADVVFMDHLMPGMDGFQAVQAIKNNPETATIPVIMYTSQEGELYLSQARALGAVGVLPKTINQSDVSRVLYQLHLLPDRRQEAPGVTPAHASTSAAATHSVDAAPLTERPAQTDTRPEKAVDTRTAYMPAGAHDVVHLDAHPAPGEMEVAIRTAVTPLLKEHGVEMRRLLLASLEVFARRIDKNARQAALHAAPVQGNSAPRSVEGDSGRLDQVPAEGGETISAPAPRSVRRRWPLAAAIAALALLPTAVLTLMQLRAQDHIHELARSNAHLTNLLAEQHAGLRELQQTLDNPPLDIAAALLEAPRKVATANVPYGEAPLAGARLERLREMIAALQSAGFEGRLRIATFTGEFCLTGNSMEGYSLAADDTPLQRCDLVGNPFEDALTAAQRQSLAFANLIASTQQETTALTFDIHYEGRKPSVPYPDSGKSAQLSAGEWNRIAAQNNRVEFIALPAGS